MTKFLRFLPYIFVIILSIFNLCKYIPILNLIFLLTIYFFFIKYSFRNKREMFFLMSFSLLFSLCQVIGYNCYNFDTAKLNNLNTYIHIFSLVPIVCMISDMLYNLKKVDFNSKNFLNKLFNEKYSIFLLILLIFIAWLPILFAFYPGNFSYDAGTQLRMIKFNLISKYHPVIHTFFLYITIFLGNNLFNSYDIGLLIHSVLQMLIMASIFSYTLIYLSKKKLPNIINFIFLLVYMFLPTHSIFSITTTKDIIFSGLFNIAFIKLIDLSSNTDEFLNNKKCIISMILILFLLLIFRNNMLYAFIIFIPYALVILKKYFKKVLIIFLCTLSLFTIYDITLTRVFKIEDGPKVEAFSFVVQHFARVYNKENLSITEKRDIESLFIEKNSLKEYNSHISDPVKSNFNTKEFLANKGKYISLYINLFKKYPLTYIDSILDNTYGFFYLGDQLPDPNTRTYVEITCLDSSNDTIQRKSDCKKNYEPLYNLYYDLLNNAKYQKIPILNITMNMALYSILLMFVSIYVIYKRKYRDFIPISLLLCYFLTNMLAPVAIVRYIYPIFTNMPLLLYLFYINLGNKNNNNCK